jgi:hypothetical protein
MSHVLTQSRIVKRLAPDQDGAKKHSRRFGDALVCVRYRQDRARNRRYTTVELVVDEGPMQTSTPRRTPTEVYVLIRYEEAELRRKARAAGAIWDDSRKVWRMSKRLARELQLLDRVMPKTLPPIAIRNGKF